MEQHRNARAGETPPTSGIVRHYSQSRKFGIGPARGLNRVHLGTYAVVFKILNRDVRTQKWPRKHPIEPFSLSKKLALEINGEPQNGEKGLREDGEFRVVKLTGLTGSRILDAMALLPHRQLRLPRILWLRPHFSPHHIRQYPKTHLPIQTITTSRTDATQDVVRPTCSENIPTFHVSLQRWRHLVSALWGRCYESPVVHLVTAVWQRAALPERPGCETREACFALRRYGLIKIASRSPHQLIEQTGARSGVERRTCKGRAESLGKSLGGGGVWRRRSGTMLLISRTRSELSREPIVLAGGKEACACIPHIPGDGQCHVLASPSQTMPAAPGGKIKHRETACNHTYNSRFSGCVQRSKVLMRLAAGVNQEILGAFNIEVLRAGEGGARGVRSGGKREIPEKIRRPAASSGTIPTSENPGATSPGIELCSPGAYAANIVRGAALAGRLHCSPPTKGEPGHSRIFASGKRVRRCHCSAGFLGDLPFLPPLHSGTAQFSPHFNVIGSQDIVKSHLNSLNSPEFNIVLKTTPKNSKVCNTCNSETNARPSGLSRSASAQPWVDFLAADLIRYRRRNETCSRLTEVSGRPDPAICNLATGQENTTCVMKKEAEFFFSNI
ncbi:hypothetical protein PR048_022165 [Dryococelus australis]|uniref:Uncharacterized protein n=1 Tax=Dryococelus australis TaxID=614101 RepID=A0ABQ9H091_9NEOP|nr:hypothetical protein PR048_022165 [Dryococelus australis]